MTLAITRRRFVGTAGAMAALPFGGTASAARAARPNILFIMADDLGYADLGCYGARSIQTPCIDRLADEGQQLFQGYANSPVCSPTRVALITGRYQYRIRAGLDEPIGIDSAVGLPPEHPTLPSLVRQSGYRTSLIGKWHLGEPPKFGPTRSGYEQFFGIHEGGADYFTHRLDLGGHRSSGLYEGITPTDREGYLTELLADRAIEEIEAAAAGNRPFFMSLHLTAPHWPWEGPGDAAVAAGLDNPLHFDGGNLDVYRRMVEAMDAQVGRVLATLARLGIAKDTIVVFTSDNGGERFSDTWPFVGAKTELLEGGLRVPLLVRWPGRIAAGSKSEQVMISMDFLPTLLAAAGAAHDPAYPPDGENLLPVLTGATPARPRTLFWRYKAADQAAVRHGDWKYLRIRDREFLFDLATDQRERANLKDRHPEEFERLKTEFYSWNRTMLSYPPDSPSSVLADVLADRF